MAWLFDERAPERYFIKPLNDDGDSVEVEQYLPVDFVTIIIIFILFFFRPLAQGQRLVNSKLVDWLEWRF